MTSSSFQNEVAVNVKNLSPGQVFRVTWSAFSDYYGDSITFIDHDRFARHVDEREGGYQRLEQRLAFLSPRVGVFYVSQASWESYINMCAFIPLTNES